MTRCSESWHDSSVPLYIEGLRWEPQLKQRGWDTMDTFTALMVVLACVLMALDLLVLQPSNMRS
jgi:hypothetical protein